PLEPPPVAGAVDEDAPHGLGRGGEEVAAALPARVVRPHEPEIGLVDQGGGLERLARLLLRQPPDGEPPQLVLDQGQELLSRLLVATLDGREDAGHVVHRGRPTWALNRAARESYPGPSARDASHPGYAWI